MLISRTTRTARSAWIDSLVERPSWLLTLAVLVVLFPFITKPFNIDDPLFIWIARHIQSHPADPYSLKVNWYLHYAPVSEITKNPPLACYYLSLAGSLLGWSEPALHAAMLLPAIAAILGTHRLAGRFCQRPIHAALLTLFTPVFLVSGTTVMCDVMMLAFWVWSLVFWIEGTEQSKARKLALAAVLIALASLTKYFGVCLIPLVAAWSIAKKRPLKEWLGWLAVPAAVLIGYQFATRALYGRGLLADAMGFASIKRQSSFVTGVSGLTFTGGCLAVAVFFTPFLWTRRGLIAGTMASLFLVGVLCFVARSSFPAPLTAMQVAQILFWGAGGAGVLVLALSDLVKNRSADSLLLACWLGGTFCFATFCNWIINGRSILPMTIPASILLVRRLEQRAKNGVTFSRQVLLVPSIAGAALAIWVAAGDYFFAQAAQTAARTVCAAYADKGGHIWFEGHWGFQYYMEQGGATAIDFRDPKFATGDHIAVPSHNTNIVPLNEPVVQKETILVPMLGGIATMNTPSGAGFYASLWGQLPFAIGPGAVQTVQVFAYDPSLKGN